MTGCKLTPIWSSGRPLQSTFSKFAELGKKADTSSSRSSQSGYAEARPKTKSQQPELDERAYQNNPDDILIKVMVYKGQTVTKEKNNLEIKGNQVSYNGKSYPLDANHDNNGNKFATFVATKDKPLFFNGHQYHGTMIVSKKNFIYVVNVLPMELYVMGVVRKEISHSWPDAAIEAQTIATRTYAYRKYLENYSNPYHLKGDTSDQVYAGTINLPASIIKGAKTSEGEILTYNDYPILTFFHATCGGMTEKPEDVWGGEHLPYLESVLCGYCTTHPNYSWSYTENASVLIKRLSQKINAQVKSFNIKTVSDSKRVKEVIVNTDQGEKIISGNTFRLAVGATELLSTKFKIKRSGNTYMVEGNGYGHGVGLCQWGTKTLAENGRSANYILNFYYQNVKMSTIKKVHRRLPVNAIAKK